MQMRTLRHCLLFLVVLAAPAALQAKEAPQVLPIEA